ncbi:ATP-binding cassette sub-family G member 4-like isoform X3 [Bombus pascuorum]|uniref:ATP-binding cassette sub-family G member 4-like isoform X3 n=1 Tax=Bombus pascuorum TaxID=65598 RepID=UPI00298D7AF8|nr:ATP-binding cassette sub-family G member 4-like isoform X3 [Bombus pascuorum]
MEAHHNNAIVNPSARMIDEEECTVQLTMGEDQKFLNPDSQSVTKMHIEFDNLSYSICSGKEKSKRILEDVTGCFRPERLTAIIGPSGAGKTTLLRIICNLKSTNVKGSITVNGKEWNGRAFRKQTCFLPQEFALQPLLTARETLYIAARLKVQGIRELRSFNLIVTEIAENLNLTSCLDTLVENLSGGERKRLSIGVEIITKPSVLLLDEPTSGLDSTSSNQVIGLLHKIAKGGCTVVCAIHQPSSRMISQFDDLLVIHNGTSFYCGAWNDVFCTFSEAEYVCPQFYNISEFVVEVVTGERSGDLNNLQKLSRDKYSKWKKHFQHPIRVPIEAAVFIREYLNNWYHLRSYFSVKVLSDLPLQILTPSVFISIAYYMTGQPMECDRFLRTWLICILTTILGQSSGMLVGAAFDTHMGIFLIPALNMPMILFAGFFLKFREVPSFLQPLCSISFFRYGFEGILQAIYDGDRKNLRCDEIYCPLRSPKKILKDIDMPAISYYMTVLGLSVWIVCLQLLTYLILKWKAHKAKS